MTKAEFKQSLAGKTRDELTQMLLNVYSASKEARRHFEGEKGLTDEEKMALIMAAKQKILIVDDDNNIAELVSLYLTKECFETSIVNDGEEALKQFDEFRPDIILLDIDMPDMNGLELTHKLHAFDNNETAVIILTGYNWDIVGDDAIWFAFAISSYGN